MHMYILTEGRPVVIATLIQRSIGKRLGEIDEGVVLQYARYIWRDGNQT